MDEFQSFDNELHLLEQLTQQLLIYAIRSQQLASFWPVLVDGLMREEYVEFQFGIFIF